MAQDTPIFPSSWCLCKASAPTTNYKEGIAYASSTSEDVWSDESVTAFKFSPVLPFNKLIPLVLGRLGVLLGVHSGLANGVVESALAGIGMRIELAANYGVSIRYSYEIQLVPIYNDFDTSILTWSTLSGLDTGAGVIVTQQAIIYNIPTFIGGSTHNKGTHTDIPFAPNQLSGNVYLPNSDLSFATPPTTRPGVRFFFVAGKGSVKGCLLNVRARDNRPATLNVIDSWVGLQPFKSFAG